MNNQWHIDEYCRIIGVNLHDGYLLGIHTENDQVVMTIKNSQNKHLRIIAQNVAACYVNNMLLGNIILSAYLFDLKYIDDEILTQHLSATINGDLRLAKELHACVDRNKGNKLFHLDPTYGAEIIIICKQITINNI